MTRTDDALGKLRRLLGGDRYPLNSRLPAERRLAVELGVSRSALRGGLAMLEAEGKIWRHVGKGTFVGNRPIRTSSDLSLVSRMTSPAEVLEVRLIVEPRIASLAAFNATAADIAHMQRCLLKIENCFRGDNARRAGRAFDQWDGTLHRAIAEAAHNELLLALFDAINAVRSQTGWGRLQEAAMTRGRHQVYCRQHRGFVEAIAERDPARAESSMWEHIVTVQKNLLGTDPVATKGGHDAHARRA